MAKVNLRDLYPFYTGDCFIDIPDDVYAVIQDCERKEEAYARYLRYHKVNVSLEDSNSPKTESEIVDKPLMPHEIYEKKVISKHLHKAIFQLPDKQAKRIYAFFILDMNYTEIAQAEGVDINAVRYAIERGLRNLRKNLKCLF